MANNNNQAAGGGVGFGGLLTVLFIGLKFAHVITWSWWWVLSPLWIGVALVVAIFVIVLAVAGIVALVKPKPSPRRRY